jgi:indolepyruvate ferredoxin oxidoreductase
MNAPISPELRAALERVTLDDKYTLQEGHAWMSGTQAIVRLAMLQRVRDARAGLNTAGFISGYRGSPLGGVDQQLWKASKHLKEHHVVFQPGVNEDLAATAVWGTQQVNLFPGAKYDGVFALWYGKGPGVDRCGDVFKHANAAGTSPHGGVLVLAGDDHSAKSSTLPHQSDHILKACMIPVLFPSSVQEYLDMGLHGWAMSRYAGVWVGMKCVTDIVEASASVDVSADRVRIQLPEDFIMPAGGLSIRWPDTPLDQEARLLDYKLYAALAYARANKLNFQPFQVPHARLGIVASGKAWLDTQAALFSLGLDEATCQRIGLRLFKVGMVWPLEASGVMEFAEGLDEILVVEEKRQVIEYQIKEELFGWIGSGRKIPRVIGKFDTKDGGEWAVPQGNWVLPAHYEFSPAQVARAIAQRLMKFELPEDVLKRMQQRLSELDAKERELAAPRVSSERKPWFCSGCPHNTSTRVPEGSRAVGGIGCHYMVTWMDRNTDTFTQMGGEGVPWIGQFPFTEEKHIFANLGDGTYFHSGYLAIRAAVAAKARITYKILYNDAVAMTGGQPVDGQISVQQISRQMAAEGVERIALVSDDPEKWRAASGLASGITIHHRDELDAVQKELREFPGVSVIIYEQTCASEKRRRRKKIVDGKPSFPDPARRVVINEAVCEGCGDCSVQSNCLSVEPLETEFGRKRQINQSSCNKDFSCLKGFCPSFVTVEGGKLRKPKAAAGAKQADARPTLPEPVLPALTKPWGILVTGVGGTGVVTIGQLLGMAAHLEGKGCSVLDMAGLAQKGGAVSSHIILAADTAQIRSTRVAMAEADLLLGCDLIVSTQADALSRIARGRTHAVLNTDTSPTADFVKDPNWQLPADELRGVLSAHCGEGQVDFVEAASLATALLGDAIYTNPFMLGYAWQKGWIPLQQASIKRAIELNGVSIQANLAAFDWGRAAAMDLTAVQRQARPAQVVELRRPVGPRTLEELIARRVSFLTEYQNASYARRYEDFVRRVAREEQARTGTQKLATAVAQYLFKLMAYKDEYEVARLHSNGELQRKIAEQFEGDYKLNFHLAPPLLAKKDAQGRLIKRAYGPWMMRAFGLLAKLRFLRGSALDVFGYTEERRMERALIEQYRGIIEKVLGRLDEKTLPVAVELARLPDMIRGFGHVKEANVAKAHSRQAELLAQLEAPVISIEVNRAA